MAAQSDSAGLKLVNVASFLSVLKGSPIYAVCMRLETTVNDKKKIYIDKVGALMSVLENVLTGYLSQTSPEQTLLLFEFLHRHTLNLILHGDWGKHNAARQHMTFQFKRFEIIANRKNLPQVAADINCLLDLLVDPWGNPIITRILNGEECTEEEELRLIKAEMGIVLIVRLEIMAEARCDAQALALIEVCLKCVSHQDHRQYFQQFSEEIVYIRDIYLILLVRAKNNTKVLNEVNKMGLVEGLHLVRRCSKGERMVRLRKSHKKMADIVANMAMTSAMIKPITEEQALHDLIVEWYNLYQDTPILLRLLRKMIVNAVSSQHIYLLGQIFVEKHGRTEKLFCIELYIRALTVNLNELEKYKSNSEQDKVKESEVQLSNGFLLLADYLKDDILTCRECVLTAFSLNPTRSCYERIKNLAVASGKLSSEQDDDCENNQSSINCEKHSLENHDPGMKIDTGQPNGIESLNLESQLVLTQQIAQLSYETREKQMKANETDTSVEGGKNMESTCDILSSPIHISDALKIGIPQTLCDDLTTVISSARYQVLNWHLDWLELSSRCESYIISGKEHRSTEKVLKYLNIDYNQFKDWPRDKMYDIGIEKGFEEFVETDSADETDTSTELPKRRQSKQSMDDETQDSLDFAGKIQVKEATKTPFSSTATDPERVAKTTKKQERIKRKALSSISDTEIVDQDRLPGNLSGNEEVVLEKKSIRKKTKIAKSDRKNRSLLKPRTDFQIKPPPLNFLPLSPPDQLDLESIEEDATRISFSPLISTEEYLSLLKTNNGNHKNHDIISTPFSDNTEINKNNPSQMINNQAIKTASSTEDPNYCIIENDLSVTDTITLSSPTKLSDPTVLKTLRMYRSKKPGPETINGVSEKYTTIHKFPPLLETVHINPRIFRRTVTNAKPEVINIDITESTSPEVITLDEDSGPEIIDLVDEDDEEDNNMSTINSTCFNTTKIPYDVTSKMKLNFDSVLKSNSLNRKSAFSKPRSLDDLARTLGLKSVGMIRPATGETTVQVVQLSNSARSLVTSNSNTNTNTTMAQQTTSSALGSNSNSSSNVTTVIYTMPQQSPPSVSSFAQVPNHSSSALGSNSDLASNVTTVIYTMPQHSISDSFAQVPNNNSSALGSNSDLASNVTTVIYTMPQHSISDSFAQVPNNTSSTLGSNNNLASNITPVIYTMPQQSTSVSFAQVPNNTVVSNSSLLYTMPQQTSSSAQVRSTTSLLTTDTSSKPVVTNSTTLPSRNLSSTGSQASSTNAPSSFTAMSSPRNFYSSPRHVFPQNQGVYVSRQSPERALLSPPPITNQPSPINIRRNTPSPRETVVANTETTNVPINVIRVERISLVPSSESNQPMPNLSPIKNSTSTRPQTGCMSRQQVFMRNNISRATTNTSTQSPSVVSSSRGQTNLPSTITTSTLTSSRSMPVTAHIQRVGYPPETSQSSTGVQLKYIFKEGVLSSSNEKNIEESEADTNSVAMVLSSDQVQQLLPKSNSQDKSPNEQDDNRAQVASLPKFQQAFGRTMYQNSAAPSGNTSSSESPALNFVQQIQPSNASTDSVTSSICTVLSKAVQTTTKDSDVSNKTSAQSNITNEHSNHRKLSLTANTSTSTTVQTVAVSTATTQIETQLSSNIQSKTRTNERTTLLQQTPVKILTLSGTNLLPGKSVAILKTSVPPEKLTQAQVKYDGDNRSKETVIRSNMSNMSALLAAALQAQQPQLRQVSSGITNQGVSSQVHLKTSQDVEKKKPDHVNSSAKNLPQKNFRKIPPQNQPSSRYTKPLVQVTGGGGNQNVTSSTPVVTIPIRTALAAGQQTPTTSRLSTERVEVRSENLVSPSPPEDPSGSSLLDQQLKEFESVFNKVKKTSQMKERTNSTTVQIQPHLSLGQQILLTQPSSSSNVEFANTSTNQTPLFQSTSTSTIHDLQGERVSLTFISQPATGATNTLIPGTSQKITSTTPVVVVQSCSKPVTSPALSATSQSSSSPAPPSTPGSSSGKISTTAIVKQNKSNKTKTIPKTTPTTTLKVSTLPKPQQKPQEDEQTTQRIYAILDKYAEQLRNSPELKNKPAPRRRSNPPTNPNQNSKRKKSTQTKSKLPSQQASCSSSGMEMSPGSEDMRTIGSEDSSNGVSQLSQTLNSPQSRQDDPSTPTGDVSSETSESLDSRDTRIQSRVVLAETSTGQSRTVIVQDNVPTQVLNVDASKLLPGKPVVVSSQTIVPQLVLPTSVGGVQKMQLFPVPTDGRPFVVTKLPKAYRVHQVTMPRGAPSLLAPGAVVRIPMCGTSAVKQVKLPVSGISTQNISNVITSGSHTFTVTHDTGLDINLDNAILLNSTPQQSISFVHRSIPSSSYQTQDSSLGTATTVTASSAIQKTTMAYSTTELNVGYIKREFKQESGNTLPMCSSINVIPASSSQDTKPTTSSNLTCITLDDDIEYTSADRRSSVTSDGSTLVISQASGDNKLWRTSESTKPDIKRETGSQDFSNFQSSKSALGHRSSSTSSFLSDQDHFMDSKKMTEKDGNMDNNHDLVEIKEEVKPERVMQEPELCDESVSSDSAGSGRVKMKSEEKSHLMPESSQDIGSPWPYNVTKIECIVKSDSHNTSVKQEETESQSLTLSHSQGNVYKKKSNNVENTIYQMAFKRTDRSKISKEHAAALERNIQLQKSLSEECEDLGVEEPSTNDLFPEAELLLDPDHSSHDSQIDLPSETFSQTLNSSSSSDSRAMSPMFPVGKRPVTYKSPQKCQSIVNKTNRFTPIFNPVYQFTEESTSGTVSSTRPDSPDCQIIGYKFLTKGHPKLGSNSESSSPLTTKSLSLKGNVSPMVLLQKAAQDQQKSSSSGASTPVNGGESMASPNNDELPNSYTSEETQCTQKTSDDNCKDTEMETTTDSDSNIEALNVSTCQDNSLDNKSSFIPIPNPAASSPFTYAGNRSSLKMSSRKVQMKHEIWKSILRGSDSKEDLDSDVSDPDQVRISDKRSTSTDEDIQSEGEIRVKNGLGTESEETQLASDRNTRSTKKLRKRSGPLLKCSSSKSKVPRRADPECVEEIISELATPSSMCKNAAAHHDSSSRRSSLRGHIKKNCPCCNGSTERSTKSPQKTEKFLSVTTPSPSALVIGLNKKKSSSKNTVKTSHITKKR